MTPELLFTQMLLAMCDDELYSECMDNSIDSMPETLDFCTPECAGQMDAEEDMSCDPTRHGFRTVLECEAYIIAWKAVGELEDLIDGREHEDFVRRGC